MTIDNGLASTAQVPAGSSVDVTVHFVGGNLSISSIDPNLSCPTIAAGQIIPGTDINTGPAIYYQGDATFSCTTINPILLGSSNSILLEGSLASQPDTVNGTPYVSTTTLTVGVPSPETDVDLANNTAAYVGFQP